MKYIIIFSIITLWACNHETKEDSWSEAQKENYLTRCEEGFVDAKPDEERAIEGLCECMLEEIMEEHTPEQAKNITPDQQRQILVNCNYNW